MTIEEAVKLMEKRPMAFPYSMREKCNEALDMAITALRAQQQHEQLWHDAKADPPQQDGLYYGAKDNTNAMWSVQYRDGIWTLDSYPEQQMDIVRWAFYDAFCGDDEQEAENNDPLTLNELREMDGKPVYIVTTSWYGWPCWAIVNSGDGRCETKDLNFMFSEIDQLWTAYRRQTEKEA